MTSVSIIGCGYVGLVTGICLADLGHRVVFVDIDPEKVAMVNSLHPPVHEPGLDELLQKNAGRIRATTDCREAVLSTDCTMICVGTPLDGEGRIDLSHVRSSAGDVGAALKDKPEFHTVIVKSTVIPGTTSGLVAGEIASKSGKTRPDGFSIVSNPEFLREGAAIRDFFSPDRIIVGVQDPRGRELAESLYAPIRAPRLITGIETAEMVKYASNGFLATKISYANEIGNLCKVMGVDAAEVFAGVGLDRRIGPDFFRAGIGFGGSCLPKDVRALIGWAEDQGVPQKILSAVLEVNEGQPGRMIELLKRHVTPRGATIGVLGLAFKPGTDDIRESRAVPLIRALLREGAEVVAYDPVAMEPFKRVMPGITYASEAGEVLAADAVLIVTEWGEFEALDYSGTTVIDGRGLKSPKSSAAVYEGVCWP